MTRRRRRLAAVVIVLLSVPAFARAQPGAVICALISASAGASGSGALFVQESLPAETKAQIRPLLHDARRRIAEVLWTPHSRPTIIVLDGTPLFGLLPYNPYASAVALPFGSCVLVGPDGLSVDVMAHELVHPEVAFATGYWRYLADLPRWLDEGVAMQVDRRARYGPQAIRSGAKAGVREETGSGFYHGSREKVTSNYASAKAVVADLIVEHEVDTLYNVLREGNYEDVLR